MPILKITNNLENKIFFIIFIIFQSLIAIGEALWNLNYLCKGVGKPPKSQ